MFVIGFDVIKDVIGEDVSFDELGGVDYQVSYGNIYQVVEFEVVVYQYVWDFLLFLLFNCFDKLMVVNFGLEFEIIGYDLEFDLIVLDLDNMVYDMYEVLLWIFDDGDFFDVVVQVGQVIIIGYVWVDGWIVGVVVNQFMYMLGVIDNEVFDKVVWFIWFSDVFDILLVFVVDILGFLFGVEQEKNGIIKCGGRFLYVVVEVDVLKVMIIICKFYGGVYVVMGFKQLIVDLNFVWFIVCIVVIGVDGVVQLLMKCFLDLNVLEV